jgi:predicted nucleic acid-binding Zn ribbon protein
MSKELPPRIGELLDETGKRVGVGAAVETGKLWARWGEIVGPDVAAHAQPSSLREGILRVRADTPAWATEVGYLGEEIRRRANDVVGRAIVTEVRIWSGPPRAEDASEPPVERRRSARPNETRDVPRTDDPAVAMERARSAWTRRKNVRSRPPFASGEIKRKSW